jgi:uncharacterized membrane protein
MSKWAFAITAIPTFMPIPAMIAFAAMVFSGFTGRASMMVAGAIILVPFAVAVHLSPYGKAAKIFMWFCIAVSTIVVLYTASLMPESLAPRAQ